MITIGRRVVAEITLTVGKIYRHRSKPGRRFQAVCPIDDDGWRFVEVNRFGVRIGGKHAFVAGDMKRTRR